LREFAGFESFRSPGVVARIPDPVAPRTLESSKLDWSQLDLPAHGAWLARYSALIELRRREVTPLIPHIVRAYYRRLGEQANIYVSWRLLDGGALRLVANLGSNEVAVPPHLRGTTVYATHPAESLVGGAATVTLPPWGVVWLRESERT
jgi:1,4-alpha-glucan branching enzyme